ncbi:helix-turn-helix domain-containing protein [Enterobacteriaceae bacterium RIT702]|nr:helix-turn-helix domain-containing protein [Enterobacteriaceae bacterium RIT702]
MQNRMLHWRQHTLQLGDLRVRQLDLARGMRLVQSDYRPLAALTESSQVVHLQPQLVLTFGLSGESRFRAGSGHEVAFSAGHLTVTSFQHSAGERLYRAGERVQQLRLILNVASASHYFGDEQAEQLFQPQLKRHLFSRFGHATVAQLAQINDDPLMLEIQALSLLALHRHQLQLQCSDVTRLHPHTVQRLEQAHEWMCEHLSQPFSLSTLATAVGLSDYQLKKGFQQHFRCTPGAMLLQMRMEHAHALLEQGFQVAQAAWQVGYQHPRNFSVAFQRYFGRPASAITGRKKKN